MCEIRPNGTNKVMAYSIDLKDRVEFDIDDEKGPKASWARYLYGIVQEMKKRGVDVKGFNTAFAGDVPLGAGLSSSAALESCYAYASTTCSARTRCLNGIWCWQDRQRNTTTVE